ncbi:MAG: hypothetical protein DRJ63_08130 [Thermoprotei archaeon]|nr:MAG: hypothetical protein DRJ63_08130 [Thermoprotei archaeon]
MLDLLSCGFLVADIVVADLNKIAEPGELVFAPKGITISVGGHPANLAIDLVKLGIPGEKIGVAGAVGNDIFGEFIERTLASYGLRLFIQKVDRSTNKNVILVVKGEDRRFHVELGASRVFSPSIVLKLINETKPRVFYLASGILDLIDKKIEEIFKKAKERKALTFADIVKPYGKDWSYIVPAMKYIDVFHCNESELKELTRAESLREAVNRVFDYGVKLLFITMGEKGALGATRHMNILQKAFKVDTVDPTGAGDAFCAGIIYKLLEYSVAGEKVDEINLNQLKQILLYAQAVGASACTAPGTTAGVTREKVEELIKTQGENILVDTAINIV